jgi:hypothetical protein
MRNAQNIRELLEDIANLLLEHEQEQRETILFEQIENLCIYRSNCWDIINEERPVDFYNEDIGEHAQTPEQLAWSILYAKFMDEYSTLIY